MRKIISGFRHFHDEVFPTSQAEFERLANKQQKPIALFITCSDSRVNPNLITQTDPGDLFLIRNVGNMAPTWGNDNGSEAAAIEYAITVLGIQNIIVCGHSHCGAMQAMLENDLIRTSPALRNWFGHAEATRRIVESRYADKSDKELLMLASLDNVVQQIAHLKTHPAVAAGEALGNVNLFGWFYRIETGDIWTYRPRVGDWIRLVDCDDPEELNMARELDRGVIPGNSSASAAEAMVTAVGETAKTAKGKVGR